MDNIKNSSIQNLPIDAAANYATGGAYSTSRSKDNVNVIGNYPWSEDNPYLPALLNSSNNKNRRSYLQAALSWEEARGNQLFTQQLQLELMELERQWSLEDRAHDEAYNSPIAQVQRQRAAGLNPDLQGIDNTPTQSQAVPQGTAPAQQSSPVELPELGDGWQIFAQIFSTVVSGAASLASAGATLASFPSIRAKALVDQATAQNQIDISANQAAISSENLSQSKLSTQSSKLSLIDTVARLVGSQTDDQGNPVPITSDALQPVLSALGLDSDDDQKLVQSYLKSAPVRRFVSDQSLGSKRSIAQNVVESYDQVQEYAGVAFRAKLYQQYSEMYENDFMSRISQYKASSDALLDSVTQGLQAQADLQLSSDDLQIATNESMLASGVPELSAQAQAEQARSIVESLQAEAKAFGAYIDQANVMIAKLDKQIAKFEYPQRPLTDADYQALNKLYSLRSLYCVQTRSTMYRFASQAMQTYQSLGRVSASYYNYHYRGPEVLNYKGILSQGPEYYEVYWEPGLSGEETLSPLIEMLGTLKFFK